MEWTTQVLTSLLVFEISEFWSQLTLTQWHALCGKNMLFVVNTEHLHRNVPTLISNPFTKMVIPSLYIQQSLCMYTSTLHGWQNGCCEGKTTRYWSVCLVVTYPAKVWSAETLNVLYNKRVYCWPSLCTSSSGCSCLETTIQHHYHIDFRCRDTLLVGISFLKSFENSHESQMRFFLFIKRKNAKHHEKL